MKTRFDGFALLCFGLLLLGSFTAEPLQAASVKRVFKIDCQPPDATAQLTLIPNKDDPERRSTVQSPPGGAHGFQTEPLKVYKDDAVEVTISRPDYESFTTNLTYEVARAAVNKDSVPVVIVARLAQLQREVPVQFEAGSDAQFSINNTPCAASSSLRFARANSSSPWSTLMLKVERPNYKTVERELTLLEAENAPLISGRRQIVQKLDEIRITLEFQITPNESDTKVFVNDKPAGALPGKVSLVFDRADGASPWSSNLIRIEKEGYEYRPPGTVRGLPVIQTNLTLEVARSLAAGIELPYFQPVRFFEVALRRFTINRGDVSLQETNSISAKDMTESTVLNPFGKPCDPEKGEAYLVGRIGASSITNAAGRPGEIVMSIAFRESRGGTNAEVVGSSLCLMAATGVKKVITDAEPDIFDIDPCITRDGQYVYYASNRRGQWGIWKKPATRGGGLTPIDPGRGIDLEPAVSTSPEGRTRVAFTRYFVRAALNTPPRIVVQSEDGSTFAETERGRSPAWSHDGLRIAYVSTDNKIWLMDATGENPRQLTTGPSVDSAPLWLQDGKHLVYSSARNPEDARGGTGNFDLWMIDAEGNDPRQLTSNQSFDSFPVTTWAGERPVIYFVSNRGAQSATAEPWQIYYFELRWD